MFDILDFIDSKDIREYNRNTRFLPIEQAILIELSLRTMLSQKLDGWKTLLNMYSSEEFQAKNVGILSECNLDYRDKENMEQIKPKEIICFKDIIQNTVNVHEMVLNKRYEKDCDVIYIAEYSENAENRKNLDDCRFLKIMIRRISIL